MPSAWIQSAAQENVARPVVGGWPERCPTSRASAARLRWAPLTRCATLPLPRQQQALVRWQRFSDSPNLQFAERKMGSQQIIFQAQVQRHTQEITPRRELPTGEL